MRDRRIITIKRGGLLTVEQHKQLMKWAIACAEHILVTLDMKLTSELTHALNVAKLWEQGKASTGDAMKASQEVHKIAREYTNPVYEAVARCIGHTVATAHMADHCMGAPLYALKALKLEGLEPITEEQKWQNEQLQELPAPLSKLIKELMPQKAAGFKLS